MTRLISIMAISLTLGMGAPALADDARTPMDLVRAFNDAVSRDDWETAQRQGEALLAHDRMALMPAGYRADIHHQVAISYAENGETARAQAHWEQAEALGLPRHTVLHARFEAALRQNAADTALQVYAEMDAGFPGQRNSLRLGLLMELVDLQHDVGRHAEEREALDRIEARYTPDTPFTTLDEIHYRRIRSLVESGDIDAAMAVLPAMTSDTGAMRLRTLNLFSPLWQRPEFDRLTDQRREVLDLLARSGEQIAAHPDHLGPVIDRMVYLNDLGRREEASQLATRTWHRIQAGETFEDSGEQVIWFLDQWGYVEMERGRLAFGRAAFLQAGERSENGGLNVSQLINLAHLDLAMGDDRAVLDRLESMEGRGASDYGWIQVHFARACAAAALGEDSVRAVSEAWVEAHRDVAPATHYRMLICLGRENDAAAALLDQLADPALAEDTLMELQPRDPRYTHRAFTRYRTDYEMRQRIIARPEIQAAIAPIGRLEYVDLTDG
ncbi:hypothetical protein [Maricaulis sp.]|uniref:hypothetical protein n=1 Tax=Maricaulis sp. TaxID=1486257 RepID=UPI0025B8DFA8|nr:hypothetical protein [Maricaulis sp.]